MRPTRPAAASGGDPVDQPEEDRVDLGMRPAAAAERALRADRAPPAADLHAPAIAVVRQRVELAARRPAEHRHERVLRELGDLADRPDPSRPQLLGGHRADAPEPLDRQRVEEGQLAVGRHDEEAVRLRDPARHLRQELRPGDADGDGKPDPLADVPAQPHGDLRGGARQPLEAADVEERLVDREALDDRRCVVEDPEHLLARLGVGGHAGRDDDGVGAETPGLYAAHRGADPVRLRLVAGSEDDPGPDDHGPPPKARVVPLLHGRVEGVDVRVEDLVPFIRTYVRI